VRRNNSDTQVEELRRRAASGDDLAAIRLGRLLERLGRAPTDEDLVADARKTLADFSAREPLDTRVGTFMQRVFTGRGEEGPDVFTVLRTILIHADAYNNYGLPGRPGLGNLWSYDDVIHYSASAILSLMGGYAAAVLDSVIEEHIGAWTWQGGMDEVIAENVADLAFGLYAPPADLAAGFQGLLYRSVGRVFERFYRVNRARFHADVRAEIERQRTEQGD